MVRVKHLNISLLERCLHASSGITSNFLEDPIKCILMFPCFKEVSDHKQCSVINNAKTKYLIYMELNCYQEVWKL